MLPAGQDAAEAFYRIIDAAYVRRSVAVTSNIHPVSLDTIMPKTLTTATVDRLLHRAHLVLTRGDSHRLAEALAGKGVTSLTSHPAEIRCPPTRRNHVRQTGPHVSACPDFLLAVDSPPGGCFARRKFGGGVCGRSPRGCLRIRA